MISMMNVQKDLLKFATLDRASFISSASWVRGLIIIGLNWLFGNSKLAIIKNLSQFFKHYFRPHLQCGCSEYQHLQCACIYKSNRIRISGTLLFKASFLIFWK